MNDNTLRKIKWIDTGQQMAAAWTGVELIKARAAEIDPTVTTVGFVIDWTPDYALVAQSIDNESGAVAGVMRISQKSIVEVTSQL